MADARPAVSERFVHARGRLRPGVSARCGLGLGRRAVAHLELRPAPPRWTSPSTTARPRRSWISRTGCSRWPRPTFRRLARCARPERSPSFAGSTISSPRCRRPPETLRPGAGTTAVIAPEEMHVAIVESLSDIGAAASGPEALDARGRRVRRARRQGSGVRSRHRRGARAVGAAGSRRAAHVVRHAHACHADAPRGALGATAGGATA